jgi:hypothetical protein
VTLARRRQMNAILFVIVIWKALLMALAGNNRRPDLKILHLLGDLDVLTREAISLRKVVLLDFLTLIER